MGIEKKQGHVRYVQKIRVGGRVTSKYLGTGEKGRLAYEAIISQRARDRQLKTELDREDLISSIKHLVFKQQYAESMICQGMICRQGIWRPIDSLRKPLTEQERIFIEEIQANAATFPLPGEGATF